MYAKAKLFSAIAVVFVLIFGTHSLVLAEQGDAKRIHKETTAGKGGTMGAGHKFSRFMARGEVAAPPTASSLTVTIERASKLLKGTAGTEIVFVVGEGVVVKAYDSDQTCFEIPYSDIQEGDYVRVMGKYDSATETYTVTSIVVDVPH